MTSEINDMNSPEGADGVPSAVGGKSVAKRRSPRKKLMEGSDGIQTELQAQVPDELGAAHVDAGLADDARPVDRPARSRRDGEQRVSRYPAPSRVWLAFSKSARDARVS